ncbi:MAG: sortase, partial [Chloroflexota bacterium]|nr:sortase [Chloroflexota bacterium]
PSLPPDGVPTPAPGDPGASPVPGSSPVAGGPFAPAHFASRVVVEDLSIDLPVISGDLQPPPNYPFCDVAAYVTFLAQPGEPGTTYITAHAQEGMFLPILDASMRDDGQEMLGTVVDVYTSDALLYRYEIWQVWRHITDRTIATEGLAPGEQRLVLQTSEGPFGTPEKLGVVARLLDVTEADAEFANPDAEPRDCRPEDAD